jgi:lipoprotein NlpD
VDRRDLEAAPIPPRLATSPPRAAPSPPPPTPEARKPASPRGPSSKAAAQPDPQSSPKGTAARTTGQLGWQWPLQGRVVQRFRSGDRIRRGIRIAGSPGDRVTAAAAGTVVYSGSGLVGYGNLIILQHNHSYLSAYGFNRKLLVREGDRVARGEQVAELGQGPSGQYLLHFEIRHKGSAVDPLVLLPSR